MRKSDDVDEECAFDIKYQLLVINENVNENVFRETIDHNIHVMFNVIPM